MLRKLVLVAFFLAAPPVVTALFYIGSKYLLAATSRTIDEQTLDLLALGEIAFFYVGAFLEVRSRWSAATTN